ncbi:MAG: hypothetical protein ACI9H8_002437 [Lysobacterales bacterium]|jgi:hypothetical protein
MDKKNKPSFSEFAPISWMRRHKRVFTIDIEMSAHQCETDSISYHLYSENDEKIYG